MPSVRGDLRGWRNWAPAPRATILLATLPTTLALSSWPSSALHDRDGRGVARGIHRRGRQHYAGPSSRNRRGRIAPCHLEHGPFGIGDSRPVDRAGSGQRTASTKQPAQDGLFLAMQQCRSGVRHPADSAILARQAQAGRPRIDVPIQAPRSGREIRSLLATRCARDYASPQSSRSGLTRCSCPARPERRRKDA